MKRHEGVVLSWLLFILTTPILFFLLTVIRKAPGPYGLGAGPVPKLCFFLSHRYLVYALAVFWLLADFAILRWLRCSIAEKSQPHRPAAIFFLWQVAKVAYFVFYLSLAFARQPYDATNI